MKTIHTPKEKVKRDWHLINAEKKVLGRMSTEIAGLLMGKHKPTFSKHVDVGDHVVVTNAEKIVLTGKKKQQKLYRSHSGYPGGFKEVTFEKMITEQPKKVIEHAVSGMLPKNRLQKIRMRRLNVVVGGDNPYRSKFKELKK